MDEQTTTAVMDSSVTGRDPQFDLALQMLELNSLCADGAISEDEFAAWVADLLPADQH
jgi:hypothetical protein